VCAEGAGAAAADETYTARYGTLYRLVELRSPAPEVEEVHALVAFPADGQRGWEAGAPVVVTAPPVETVQPSWDQAPLTYLPAALGVVEVQPVWPGWSVQGRETSGPADGGGPRAAAAVAAAVRFAAGAEPAADGRMIEDIVPGPVCRGPVVLASMSSGGIPAAAALDAHAPALSGLVSGMAIYEPPSLPQFVTASAGVVWMDPDPQSDADGDGMAWNDGRNHSFDEHTCTASGCTVDYGALAWSDWVSLRKLWQSTDAAALPAGMLYLDRSNNGRLDVTEASTDTDGDGAIGPAEDAFTKPHIDDYTVEGQITYYYTDEALSAAVAAGTLALERWPSFLARPLEARAFWSERNMAARLEPVAAAHPGLHAAVTFKALPHGCAAPTRPNVRLVHDLLAASDSIGSVRYNTGTRAARCVVGEGGLGTYAGGPEPGATVDPATLSDYAFPSTFEAPDVKAIGIVEVLESSLGALDACP